MASKKDKYLESAQRFVLKGQIDKAIKDYEQIVALDPKEIRHRQKLAELLARENRKEEAIAQYEGIGKHYAENSYFLKAIAVYKQIQRLCPTDTAISLTLASLNHQQGLIGNALAEYSQVLMQFEKESDLKEAVKVVEKMLAIDGEPVATRLKYAELLFATGAKDPSYQAFSALLSSLRGAGDSAAAKSVLDRIQQLFPGHQENDLDLISERISAGDLDGAIASLRERLQRDSGSLQAWQLLCDAERRKGNPVGLRDAYREMAGLFPDDLGVLEAAIRCDIEAGDFSAALALLELHLPRFIEKGSPLAVEKLYLSLPADVAKDARVGDGLRRIYEASGDRDKLSVLIGAGEQSSQQVAPEPDAFAPTESLQAPSAFGPESAVFETSAGSEMPSGFGAEWAPEAPGTTQASGQSEAPELSSAWEEEIELDLDDDLHEPLLAATTDIAPTPDFDMSPGFDLSPEFDLSPGIDLSPEADRNPQDDLSPDVDLSLDFSLSLDFDEGDPLAEASGDEPGLQEEGSSLEFTLPGEPESDWAEETEEVESSEPSDIAGFEPETRKPRGWQEIYPESESSAAAANDLEELESHYDLGIGYKEMGLYNSAIKEFDVAAGNPQRRLDCLTLQAICYREKGEPEKAQDLLRRGRELEVLSADERMSLSYELAFLMETTGALDEAISLYREVYQADPVFHDVAQRLSALSGEEPLDVIELELEEGEY